MSSERVKVYRLNEWGNWDDQGTGKLRCLKEAGKDIIKVSHIQVSIARKISGSRDGMRRGGRERVEC